MTTRSMEQIRADYIDAMGEELGVVFYVLHRELVALHAIWQQYQQLFGKDDETVSLLNRTAGLFFKIAQDEIWDGVLLRISRMTDPPITRGKKNLTINSLPPLIDDQLLKGEVEDLCTRAVVTATFARERRNKRIAHQDHDYYRDREATPLSGISRVKVEEMLDSIRTVLNRINLHYRDATNVYEQFVAFTGADQLVSRLRKLEKLEAST